MKERSQNRHRYQRLVICKSLELTRILNLFVIWLKSLCSLVKIVYEQAVRLVFANLSCFQTSNCENDFHSFIMDVLVHLNLSDLRDILDLQRRWPCLSTTADSVTMFSHSIEQSFSSICDNFITVWRLRLLIWNRYFESSTSFLTITSLRVVAISTISAPCRLSSSMSLFMIGRLIWATSFLRCFGRPLSPKLVCHMACFPLFLWLQHPSWVLRSGFLHIQWFRYSEEDGSLSSCGCF